MKWRGRWYFIKPWKHFSPSLFNTWEKCLSFNCGNFCRTTHERKVSCLIPNMLPPESHFSYFFSFICALTGIFVFWHARVMQTASPLPNFAFLTNKVYNALSLVNISASYISFYAWRLFLRHIILQRWYLVSFSSVHRYCKLPLWI